MDRKPPQTGARLFAAITERASAHPVSVLPPLVTFWPIGAADSDPDGFAFARQGTFLGGTEEGLHLARKAATDKKKTDLSRREAASPSARVTCGASEKARSAGRTRCSSRRAKKCDALGFENPGVRPGRVAFHKSKAVLRLERSELPKRSEQTHAPRSGEFAVSVTVDSWREKTHRDKPVGNLEHLIIRCRTGRTRCAKSARREIVSLCSRRLRQLSAAPR